MTNEMAIHIKTDEYGNVVGVTTSLPVWELLRDHSPAYKQFYQLLQKLLTDSAMDETTV